MGQSQNYPEPKEPQYPIYTAFYFFSSRSCVPCKSIHLHHSNYGILKNKLTYQVSSSMTSSVSSVKFLLTENDSRQKKTVSFHLSQSPFTTGTATKPGSYFLLFKIIYGKHKNRKIAIHILHLILSPLLTIGIIYSLVILLRVFT